MSIGLQCQHDVFTSVSSWHDSSASPDSVLPENAGDQPLSVHDANTRLLQRYMESRRRAPSRFSAAGFSSPLAEPDVHLSLCVRLSRRHGKVRRVHCLTPLIEFALNAEYTDLVSLMIRVHVITPPQRSLSHLPAFLRHVYGFPVPRLLRKLRPRCRPFPVVAASPVPYWADVSSSRVPIINLHALRRHAIPLAMRRTGHGSSPRPEHVGRAQQQRESSSAALIASPPCHRPLRRPFIGKSEASNAHFVVSP